MRETRNSQTQKAEKEIYSSIKALLMNFPQLELHKKRGSKLNFTVYLSEKVQNSAIEELDLSVRASHALHRGGLHTIGALCDYLHEGNSLKSIRNCGTTSVAEIMDHLFAYNFQNLSEQKKVDYMVDLIAKNVKKFNE